jgi:hypothetical protein
LPALEITVSFIISYYYFQIMMNHYDLAFGTNEHELSHMRKRAEPRQSRDSDDITELGHEAIRGVTTVGVVGITAGLMGGILGGFGK